MLQLNLMTILLTRPFRLVALTGSLILPVILLFLCTGLAVWFYFFYDTSEVSVIDIDLEYHQWKLCDRWDESIGYFRHWKKWICFSPDGKINRDVDIAFARLIYCTFYWRWRNPTTTCFSSSLSLKLHGEHGEDLNLQSDKENQTIFILFHSSFHP